MARKNTERMAANLASGAPALLDTSEDNERRFRSFPSFWMYLYNHIQATS